jgi:hypothetical protein
MARLVTENALQHEDFFTQFMGVCLKFRTWLIPHNARRFCNLVTQSFKHSAFHAHFGAGNPGQVMVIDDDSLAVIGVDIHVFDAKL